MSDKHNFLKYTDFPDEPAQFHSREEELEAELAQLREKLAAAYKKSDYCHELFAPMNAELEKQLLVVKNERDAARTEANTFREALEKYNSGRLDEVCKCGHSLSEHNACGNTTIYGWGVTRCCCDFFERAALATRNAGRDGERGT